MKLIKGILLTITFTLILLTVIPLTIILLIYSPTVEPPTGFEYIQSETVVNLDDYLDDIDFGNLSDLEVGEVEINHFINTYIELSEEDLEDIQVNYAYIDFMTEQIMVETHINISAFLDFPMRIQVYLNPDFDDGVAQLTLDRIRLGKVTIPNWITRVLLMTNDVSSPYLKMEDLSLAYNIRENNPYSDFVEVKDIYLEEDAIHVNFGLNDFLQEKIVEPTIDVISGVIDDIVPQLSGAEQSAVESIGEFIDENANLKIEEIDIDKLDEMIDIFMSLTPEVQDTILDEVKKSMDPEMIDYLGYLIEEQMESR